MIIEITYIFFFMILDFFIIDYLQTFREKVILNIINFVIFYTFYRLFFKKTIKFYDVFILIIPVVGYAALIIQKIIFSKNNFSAEIEGMSDSDKKELNEFQLKIIDVEEELDIACIEDIFNCGTERKKKQTLITIEIEDMKKKIKLLERALEDKDQEVIHYAAVYLNKIDREFQNKINSYKKSEDSLMLLKTYMEYCSSGLLKGAILDAYIRKVDGFFQDKETLNSIDLLELIQYYENIGELDKIFTILKEKLADNCNDLSLQKYAKKFYYTNNRLKEYFELCSK